MERKRETEHNGLLPKKGNPLNETVCYKIGGTVFEIETSCGGSELLYDKMTRLIKSETVKTPGDKEMTERYNSGSNLFVGRSLQEELNNDDNEKLSRQHYRFICKAFPRGRFGR